MSLTPSFWRCKITYGPLEPLVGENWNTKQQVKALELVPSLTTMLNLPWFDFYTFGKTVVSSILTGDIRTADFRQKDTINFDFIFLCQHWKKWKTVVSKYHRFTFTDESFQSDHKL
jgi:hypothetical protein